VTLPIPSVPKEAWTAYIQRKFSQKQIEADTVLLDRIVDLAGGHPQDTMLLCSEVYYTLLETGRSHLTAGLVEAAYERAMRILTPLFDEMLAEAGRKPRARETLFRLAAGENLYARETHPNEVKRSLDWLLNRGIIEKRDRGRYKFVEPMLAAHILLYR
jgi:hypothetical protein